ncbi:heavy metal translocating P-type ATPase [Marichromatium gracile]|uniref:heavy metal translocating P-type ATPase n=1 Tax=Marichromatium gracile TaxID=1048 RepID=UPI001F171F6C|nr:heavy metal translocating P-type ATPase [Marichromatium gracile]MCF1181865.1 heavy metal translocating P-type ATPase [Marichromatium gracile]
MTPSLPALRYRIVHQLPGRLRLRLPALGAPGYAPDTLELWLDALPEVREVRTGVATGSLVIEFTPTPEARARVIERLRAYVPHVGHDALPVSAGEPDSGLAPVATSLLALALLPLLPPGWRLALAVTSAAPTLARGVDTLVNEGVKVEVLDAVAVGLSAARGEVYAATVTDLLLRLGAYLEERTARRSDRMLARLLRPDPAPAWVERDGELVRVPGDQVEVGEIVQVGPGERIAVDGRVIDGVALVDQSAVTGEDVPVRKSVYRRVICGSVLVEGRLRIEATQVGAETTSARVARFIGDALTKRSVTQSEADRLADQRVALTLGTGAAVYAATRDLRRVQSVFLVDYACALKLGTPVAIKSGMARAAGNGVLMRGGEAIEQLAGVDTLVFDKTGTLTHSELAVTDVEVLATHPGCDECDLLALVASIEEHASHPIASAVVDAAQARGLEHISHGEVDYLVAHGLSADVAGGRIMIGSRHYLEEHEGIDFSPFEPRISSFHDAGKILLFVANREGPVGLIALRDTLRPETPETLARLRALGIERLVMISGDRRSKAEALGRELGFDAVHAEVAPEDKAAILMRLQDAGAKVAFVGDGVNDGPALAAADVGIAMPRGADIARATADILLTDDRLDAVADARALALSTMRLIRNNFRAAVGINTAILVGAASGRVSPLASAVLHNGTTLAVLLNALRGVDFDGAEERRLAPPVDD